jgi:hypothetical protein
LAGLICAAWFIATLIADCCRDQGCRTHRVPKRPGFART